MQITLKAGMDRQDSIWAIRDHTTGMYLHTTWTKSGGVEIPNYLIWEAKVSKVGKDEAQARARFAAAHKHWLDALDRLESKNPPTRHDRDRLEALRTVLGHDIGVVEIQLTMRAVEVRR